MALAPSLANAQPSSTPTFRPTNFKEQLLYQRAFEAVLWAMPAADTLVMRRAQREWGMKEGAVFYFENRPTGKTEVITFNNPLSEAGAPRPTEFIDATAKPFHGTPTFDLSYF